jgi:hypothetical protein
MYLELQVFDMPSRSRRGVTTPQTCQAGSNETKCCLYDLVIDFEKAGWEFVIAPKRYNAYICNGDCSATVSGRVNRKIVQPQISKSLNAVY